MTEREQFEAWAKATDHKLSCRIYPLKESVYARQYTDYATQLAWEAWQAARGQWLPIESAPKDGTSILALSRDSYQVIEWGAASVYGVKKWVFGECDGEYNHRQEFDGPVLWMPLPAPPQTTEKE